MNKNKKIIIIYSAIIATVFVGLIVYSKTAGMSRQQLGRALDQMTRMDSLLRTEKFDWQAIRSLWVGPLVRLANDTRQYSSVVNLRLRLDEILKDAGHGGADEISAVLADRTLLRIALLHLEAQLAPPKKAPPLAERVERVRLLATAVERLIVGAEPSRGRAYVELMRQRLHDWETKPDKETVQAFADAMDGVMCDMTLTRLAEWRRLDKDDKNYRRRALFLQADMRQLFSAPYPRLYDEAQRDAWQALTEFTNDPEKMDGDYAEGVIRKYRGKQLAIVGAK